MIREKEYSREMYIMGYKISVSKEGPETLTLDLIREIEPTEKIEFYNYDEYKEGYWISSICLMNSEGNYENFCLGYVSQKIINDPILVEKAVRFRDENGNLVRMKFQISDLILFYKKKLIKQKMNQCFKVTKGDKNGTQSKIANS